MIVKAYDWLLHMKIDNAHIWRRHRFFAARTYVSQITTYVWIDRFEEGSGNKGCFGVINYSAVCFVYVVVKW